MRNGRRHRRGGAPCPAASGLAPPGTAPASGQGKTTVTAALARLHAAGAAGAGVQARPDFLDPQIHAVASGTPVHNVDLGMCGEADIARRLHAAAREST